MKIHLGGEQRRGEGAAGGVVLDADAAVVEGDAVEREGATGVEDGDAIEGGVAEFEAVERQEAGAAGVGEDGGGIRSGGRDEDVEFERAPAGETGGTPEGAGRGRRHGGGHGFPAVVYKGGRGAPGEVVRVRIAGLRDERGKSARKRRPRGGDGVGGGGVEIGDEADEVGRGGQTGDLAGGEGALKGCGGAESSQNGGGKDPVSCAAGGAWFGGKGRCEAGKQAEKESREQRSLGEAEGEQGGGGCGGDDSGRRETAGIRPEYEPEGEGGAGEGGSKARRLEQNEGLVG